MLRRAEVFFASATELNDANECRPRFVLKGSEELWTRLARFILEEFCFREHYYANTAQDEIQKVLQLSESLGPLLKKGAGSRDFELEKLGDLFGAALESLAKGNEFQHQCSQIKKFAMDLARGKLSRLIAEEKYIASFCRNATNPTMWGHYGGAEKGFALVYETNDETIHVHSPLHVLHGSRPLDKEGNSYQIGIYKEDRLALNRVVYGKRPPKVNAFYELIPKFTFSELEAHYDVPELLSGDAAKKEEERIGLVKYSDWRYEQEIRAFFPSFSELPPDLRILSISGENLRGLIFGPRMTPTDKARAVFCSHWMRASQSQIVKNGAPEEFAFFQAKKQADRFDFEIVPIGLLGDRYCGDYGALKPMSELEPTVISRLQEMAATITRGGKN